MPLNRQELSAKKAVLVEQEKATRAEFKETTSGRRARIKQLNEKLKDEKSILREDINWFKDHLNKIKDKKEAIIEQKRSSKARAKHAAKLSGRESRRLGGIDTGIFD